jgi:large subunit ribosomal protein L6
MKSLLEKKILLSNETCLSLFLFNENKYIKFFNERNSFYFFSNSFSFNLETPSLKKKLLSIRSNKTEKFLFNSLIFYIFQFQKITRKKVSIKGLGYRIIVLETKPDVKNSKVFLQFKLGFSHLKTIVIPSKVQNYYLTKNSITFESYNASQLGNYVTKIKSFRKPDIYKGKGLHIKNQKVLVLKPLKKK